MRIKELKKHIGQHFFGLYRCGQVRKSESPTALLFNLHDATGLCTARLEIKQDQTLRFDAGDVVSLMGVVELDSYGGVQVRVWSCVASTDPDIPSWYLLPWVWIPSRARPAFSRLLQLLDRLESVPVRFFMDRLFADLAVARSYLRVPASREHHHAGQGGLLIHSVECAEAAEELARRFLPKHERALGVLGALVHDIAKTRILVEQGNNRQAISGVSQEALNLEVLAPYLRCLDQEWPNGGAAMRQMLAPSRKPGSSGRTPLLLTDFIKYIDHLSAGADLRAQVFRPLPTFRRCTRTKQGQLLVRVLPPNPAITRPEVKTSS